MTRGSLTQRGTMRNRWKLLALLSSFALLVSVASAVAAPGPTLEKLSRNTGPTSGGQAVGISGANFTGATSVHFGSAEASFTVASAKRIHAIVPQGLNTVDVTVTTPAGTTPLTPADRYTYESRPPAVTKISPNRGPAAGGTSVTIFGENFLGASAVDFGAVAASSFTLNPDLSITAVAPAQSVGRVDITVTTPYGVSKTEYCGKDGAKNQCTFVDRFKYLEPTITGVSPSGGSTLGGTAVTVTGTGFVSGTVATTFLFGKGAATAVECASYTECTMVSPAHKAGTVDVKATVMGAGDTHDSSALGPADRFLFSG